MFGEKTTTGDKTGDIIEKINKYPTKIELESVLKNFTGEIAQIPPAFSAIKVNGKRAYQIARKGEIPSLKSRKINIFSLKLIKQINKTTYKLEATVSPGTYVRSLCEDIAKSLGTLGHAASLKRIQDGKFSINAAISLDELKEKKDNIESILIPLENVLDDIPVILISCQDAEDLKHGRTIHRNLLIDGDYLAKSDDGFLGIVTHKDGVVSPTRLFKIN
jgi:tRNA pseudouridine55 synthase